MSIRRSKQLKIEDIGENRLLISVNAKDQFGIIKFNLIVDSETDQIMFTELKGDDSVRVSPNIKDIVDTLVGVTMKESSLMFHKIFTEPFLDKRAFLITSMYYDALCGMYEYK